MRVHDDGFVPKERYVSREFLDLELEHLWSRVWQVACREEELAGPGDHVDYAIGDDSIVVVRAASGAIVAFHNTCLHRGRRVVTEPGHVDERFRCPYHGWCYALDGTLVDVPDLEEFPSLSVCAETGAVATRSAQTGEVAGLRLAPVRAETFGGFVFVNLDTGAPPLLEFLDPLPELLAPYHLERLRFRSYRTTILAANWKVVVDAFNEGYHVQGLHPQILPWTDDVAIAYEPLGVHAHYGRLAGARRELRPSPRLGVADADVDEGEILAALVAGLGGAFLAEERALVDELRAAPRAPGTSLVEAYQQRRLALLRDRGVDVSGFTPDQTTSADDVYWFPNLVGPIYPGSAILFRVRPFGRDPDRCIKDTWVLEWPRRDREWRMPERRFHADWTDHDWGEITTQDYENVAQVQLGLKSSACRGVRLNARQEANILHMHRVIDRYLPAPPSPRSEPRWSRA